MGSPWKVPCTRFAIRLTFLLFASRLESLNANNCAFPVIDFPSVPANQKTELFPSLKTVTVANNPLALVSCFAAFYLRQEILFLTAFVCLHVLSVNNFTQVKFSGSVSGGTRNNSLDFGSYR